MPRLGDDAEPPDELSPEEVPRPQVHDDGVSPCRQLRERLDGARGVGRVRDQGGETRGTGRLRGHGRRFVGHDLDTDRALLGGQGDEPLWPMEEFIEGEERRFRRVARDGREPLLGQTLYERSEERAAIGRRDSSG